MSDTQKIPQVSTSGTLADVDFTNRKIGDYQLLRRIGRGGMGDVYLAEQASLKRQVAFKVLRPSLAVDVNYVQRFTQEARAAAKLVHANIVQIYEVGCRDGLHYISQEYIAGGTLRQLMAKMNQTLSAPQAILILRQVAAALQKAGEQGIVHRDIKPENIMLTPEGEVKVADFGLARITDDGESLNLTQLGMTVGSPLYMSPEQAEGKTVDPRSDIYSLGATAFHLLSGRPPFEGASALAVAMHHVKTPAPYLSSVRPDLPPGLCDIVQRMLAKQPGDRFANAAEVLRALKSLTNEEHIEPFAGLSSANTVQTSHVRFAATQQLDQLLKTQMLRVPPKIAWWKIALVVGIAFLVGTGLALITQPRSIIPTVREIR